MPGTSFALNGNHEMFCGGRAYFGLAASLDGLGRGTEAQDARAHAAKAWAHADANLPQVQKLRTSTAAPQQ